MIIVQIIIIIGQIKVNWRGGDHYPDSWEYLCPLVMVGCWHTNTTCMCMLLFVSVSLGITEACNRWQRLCYSAVNHHRLNTFNPELHMNTLAIHTLYTTVFVYVFCILLMLIASMYRFWTVYYWKLSDQKGLKFCDDLYRTRFSLGKPRY